MDTADRPPFEEDCTISDPVTRLNTTLEGRYRVQHELGTGGMATVYLADDVKHDRKVALKVLKPELAALMGAERFHAEIRTTAKLHHPNILPLFDSGEADGLLFYVTPYVEGDSLRDRLDRDRQLPVEESVRIAASLAEALDYAHRQGIIHRDIKPANVLMHDGRPLISDFGIALAVGAAGGGRLTETGLSLGTPHYMSPEQATGDHHLGPATDIYALGCVLYEMLAGEPPFTGGTPQAVLGKIITGRRASLGEQRPSVPPNVRAAVDRALERVPADRFLTAKELADALLDPSFRHVRGEAVQTERARAVAWSGWAVAAVLAAALGWSILAGRGGVGEEEHFDLVLPADRGVPDGVAQPVAVHPEGDRIFYVARQTEASEEVRQEIYVRDLSEPESLPVPGAGSAVGSIFLSPDGEWIGFNDVSEGSVKKIPAGGGTAVTLAESGLDENTNGWLGGAWGPDGTIVFASLGSRGLVAVSEDGGATRVVTRPAAEDSVRYREPFFLPDGSGVVFTASEAGYPWEGRIMMMRLEEGAEPVSLVRGHSPKVTPTGQLLFGRSTGASAVRSGGLWSAPLSPDFTSIAGEPTRLRENVLVSGTVRDRTMRFDVAHDGTLVHLPGRETVTGSLAWVDRSGESETFLAPDSPQLPSGVIGFDAPRISPSGDRIAFRANIPGHWPSFRLFTMELERGSILALSVDINADWPVWTPDGARIVFNRFDAGVHNLYWMRADNGSEPEPLIPENSRQQHPGAFTPDGRTLILQEREVVAGPDSDIRTIRVGVDDASRELIGTDALEIQPVLSSDGGWLAYVSDESGQREVYVTDFPDRLARIKISTEAAWQPLWHPGGSELFYRRLDPDAVLTVPYSVADGAFRPGPPELLFEGEGRFRACCSWGRDYDVTRDGQRFVMVGFAGREATSTRLQVVRRWQAIAR